MQKMTDYGMTSFVYADSLGNMRSINLKSYAEIQIRSSIAYATNQALCDFCHDECMHIRTDCMWYEALDSVLSEIEKEE